MYFLSLTPFAKQNAFKIHPCSCVCQEFIPLEKKRDFFKLLNSVLFMDVKIYPFPSQWTSGLFLIFGYYKWSYCKHLCLGFWMNISFNFTLVNTREWDCCICGDSMFNFVKKPQKTAKLFSRVALLLCIGLQQSMRRHGRIQLLPVLTSSWYCQIVSV